MVGNSISPLSVLVVQQGQAERERMAGLPTEDGMEVWSAKDGRQGLNMIREHLPDILITDISLKYLDGLSLIAKGREIVPDLKVIVVFGPCNPNDLLMAVEMGVESFMPLPAEDHKLREAIQECARSIDMARRAVQAEYTLHQLLDFFPGPAVLVEGLDVVYMNRPLALYLGYENHDGLAELDMGLEDFILRINDSPYDGHPQKWVESILHDPVDRDHVVYIENPRHPDDKANVFSVHYRQFPGSERRLFIFQDVSGFEDERMRLEDAASTDPLTRAINRRRFAHLLGMSIAAGEPFGLVMFDIDHFKSINDTYGHDAGDAVLREISQLVRENIRETDVLARWGGEEFMVLSPKAGPGRVLRMAERLRQAVAASAFTGVDRQITSSFGVAVHTPGESGESLVKRVDEALYAAKNSGRNKVVADS